MRVTLIGPDEARETLRALLERSGVEVAEETKGAGEAMVIAAPTEALTVREVEVLELLADGLSNKSIAARLGISGRTVKHHVAAICAKLGAENRTDAVTRGLRMGIVAL